MATEPKLVSIIIPAYNAAKTIGNTLDSAFKQTYKPIEVIVVNDGSTDDTLSIVETSKYPVRLFSTENRGVSKARTLGFMESKGEYIQYLDADDLLMPDKIQRQLHAMILHKADVAYGDWERFKLKNDQIAVTEQVSRNIEGELEIALFTNFWCPPAAILYARKVCEKQTWKDNLPVIQDARYLLDAAIHQFVFLYTPGFVAMYRDGQSQSLSKKSSLAFVKDCFVNCREIYEHWNRQNRIARTQKEAIIGCLRYCIHEFRSLDKILFSEAIDYLLTIEPNYIPEQKGLLRLTSKIFGYKKAEQIASVKNKIA
ncbi:glycosyltransferase family 2 protein [Pedobacter sp. AW1-32]|uniref:glycosyltransferase family 2 protein n=1 Tax=Pedobacter sp. AW1-32 TaxID=3383026 RepID=UPI003FEE814A